MSQDTEKVIREEKESQTEDKQPDQNIQLTLVHASDSSREILLDFAQIVAGWKRFLALWLALALGCGAIVAGIGLYQRRTLYGGDAKALVGLTLSEAWEKGVDDLASGQESAGGEIAEKAGISRLQSAPVISQALNHLGLGQQKLDKVRSAITIQNVLTDNDYNQISLYRTLLSKNSLSLESVLQVLKASYPTTSFIVSLNYRKTGLDRETAVELLDEIILCCKKEFELSNNETDLPACIITDASLRPMDAAKAYHDQLKLFCDWLQERIYLQATGLPAETMTESFGTWRKNHSDLLTGSFRSGETGYTLPDLLDETELLWKTEYRAFAALALENSVADENAESTISCYQGFIDDAMRSRKKLQSRYTSLEETVKAYERDVSIHYLPVAEESVVRETGPDTYDTLVLEMLALQEQIAGYGISIRRDQSVIRRLETAENVSVRDPEKVRMLQTELGEKIGQLSEKMVATAEDYNREAVKVNRLDLLVSASAKEAGTFGSKWKQTLMILEVLLLLGWLALGVAYGLKQSIRKSGKNERIVH